MEWIYLSMQLVGCSLIIIGVLSFKTTQKPSTDREVMCLMMGKISTMENLLIKSVTQQEEKRRPGRPVGSRNKRTPLAEGSSITRSGD